MLQHFFKYFKVNLQYSKYSKWYNGPRMVNKFLLKTELYIQSYSDSSVIIS
jgi:hypothetical protein